MSFNDWPAYVPVAKRRAKAAKKMEQLRKKGKHIQPVEIRGNKIAKSFWGRAWCEHLEQFCDYENRLPRGRTYARNGSVCHLTIGKGEVEAIVSGSSLYNVKISISALKKKHWRGIKKNCSGQVSSVLELLQGKLSEGVMQVVTHHANGLFPQNEEISFNCNCPDWAGMCKHIAAVLYGVGARLDHAPEMLFILRGVDHQELVESAIVLPQAAKGKRQVKGDLAALFGIDLDEEAVPSKKATKRKRPFSITAKGVIRIRKKFAMSCGQFASVAGVSLATVKSWEEKEGKLTLRPKSLASLEQLSGLDKDGAWELL